MFILLPFLVSILISFKLEYIANIRKLEIFMSFSSWFFTLSSLILIFLVSERFTISTFHRNIREKNYLDKEAIQDLKNAVQRIRLLIDNETDTRHLTEDCRTIKYIYTKLSKQKQDTDLHSLKDEIGDLFNKINRYKLESIGNEKNQKWQKFDVSHKRDIGEIVYRLEMDLESLLNDIKNR